MERVRRNSVIKNSQPSSGSFDNDHHGDQAVKSGNKSEIEMNSIKNQYTFSPSKDERRPSILKTETIKRMHSAIELNKRIIEKSKDASLVLLNIPTPPKVSAGDYNCNIFLFLFHVC
jgi:hypothetical protein